MSEGTANTRKDMIWNSAGTFMYAAASFLLAFISMRFAGSNDGGMFSFGYSALGQHMFTIAYFGIRPFHITDISHEYSFSTYLKARYITSVTAIFAALVYLLSMRIVGAYDWRKVTLVFLVALLKIVDGYADVLECECQREGKLWLSGKELFIRIVVMVVLYTAALIITGNIFIAVAAALLVQIAAVIVYQSYIYKLGICKEDGILQIKKLLGSTLLIFLAVFFDAYLLAAPKYAVDLILGNEADGIFNILFMPTSVIYLFANMMYKPYLTILADEVRGRNEKALLDTIRKILKTVLVICLACLLGAVVFGKWGLSAIELLLGSNYEGLLVRYYYELIFILIGGSFYALASFYYYIIIIFRGQKRIFLVSIVNSVLAFLVSIFAVKLYGVRGACIGFSIYMVAAFVLMMMVAKNYIKKLKNEANQ